MQINWSNLLPLLLLLPLYPELSEFSLNLNSLSTAEFSLLIKLFPAMLYGSSSSGIGSRGRLFTFTGRCTRHLKKIVVISGFTLLHCLSVFYFQLFLFLHLEVLFSFFKLGFSIWNDILVEKYIQTQIGSRNMLSKILTDWMRLKK